MATRLKNTKTRVIAFVLASIFFVISGYFASSFVRGFITYNTFEDRGFENTNAFKIMMRGYVSAVFCNAETKNLNSIEDFKKTTDGIAIKQSYDGKVKRINEAYDLLDKSNIQVFHSEDNIFRYRLYNGNNVYYFGYNGDLISKQEFERIEFYGEETVVVVDDQGLLIEPATVAEVKSDVQKISEALAYLFHLGNDTNYGETTRDIVLQRAKQEYENNLLTSYEYSKSFNSRYLEAIKNVKYAAFLTNGEVVSNCGITKADTHQSAAEKLGKDARYFEEYRGGRYYHVSKTEYKESKGTLALINREFEQSFVNYHIADPTATCGIQSAVFAYDESFSKEEDIMTVYSGVYDSFRNSIGGKASAGVQLAMFIAFFLLGFAACIYILSTAGKTADGGIRLLFTDKVPLAINLTFYITLAILAAVGCYGGLVCEFYTDVDYVGLGVISALGKSFNILWGALFAIFFGCITLQLSSIIRNIRAKTFWRHTLCRWIFFPIRFSVKKLSHIVETSYANASGKSKKIIAIVCTIAFAIIDFILVSLSLRSGAFFFIVLLMNIAVLIFALMLIDSYSRIAQATRIIREGQLEKTVPTDKILPVFTDHAKDINSIGDGLQNAVESAVKDQKMKAELITNVSHDLKTPLTSIVNYVDLLKRCEIEDEDAKKYLAILDEKSLRMKKLIEDLVEASKASSGAVEMHPVSLNLCEFAAQASGENEDELKAKGIEIILKTPEKPVTVFADAQKTGRIIENLLTNIKKYALENTRAYIEVRESETCGIIEFKNISKYELDIPAEELTARFVRGDASRNGEGSGLGLSIASNFCRLQGGNLGLVIDGDLFKAIVFLPKDKKD